MARPLNPLILTLVAIITILYAWKKVMPLKATIKNLRQGRDGERYVGQMLEELRERGYRIFHDIPGEGFNIDHVIVGPAGVFTIETKARSKPPTGRPTIEYDGNIIRLENGFGFDEPLKQARAQARWLTNLLNDGRGRLFRARPVVVFPDWYVERTGPRRKDDVWVLNPKALGTFLDYERAALSADRIDMASNTLAQRCRGPHHEET
ncbi:MAG: NERD domain-containing protein [Nitrospira sp.]